MMDLEFNTLVPAAEDKPARVRLGSCCYGAAAWLQDGEGFHRRLRRVVAGLDSAVKETDASFIVVRGSSGVVMAGMLATVPDFNASLLTILRKPGESSHDCLPSGPVPLTMFGRRRNVCGRYLVLDDRIVSGKTVQGIVRDMHQHSKECQLVGVCLYESTVSRWGTSFPHPDGEQGSIRVPVWGLA